MDFSMGNASTALRAGLRPGPPATLDLLTRRLGRRSLTGLFSEASG